MSCWTFRGVRPERRALPVATGDLAGDLINRPYTQGGLYGRQTLSPAAMSRRGMWRPMWQMRAI